MHPDRQDSILGCILGGTIGDAAASPFEGCPPCPPGADLWQDGEWQITDDTQLTLATCQALCQGRVDPEAIAQSMLRWHRTRRLCRPGSSTLKALRDLAEGCPWSLAGRRGEYAAGNGAAIRIAPLAMALDPTTATATGRQTVRDVCRITHHHE